MRFVQGLCALLVAIAAEAGLGADFELAPYFQDHMVLQRDQPLRIWGKAPAGSSVSVSFGGRSTQGVFESGSDVWVATFEAGFAASKESRTLTATCTGGGATVTRQIEDAVVGDVWIAAGQSNMSYSLYNPGGPTYDALSFVAEFPDQQQTIRTIMLGTENELRKPEAQDYDLLGGVWQRPANGVNAKPLPFNFMSGVAYHFARKVTQELDVPIGIVETALNAMPASMWKVGGAFYNNHLVPLHRLSFRGALWYQGENQPCEAIVRDLTAVIGQWRELFSRTAAELPFYAVQFPGYGGWDMTDDPSGDSDPGMRGTREGIARVAATVENAYMAVVWDCGDDDNIHPLEKYHPGQRLALSALRHTYGRDVVGDSPVWQTVEATGDGKLRLGFDMGGSTGFVTAVKDWQSNAEPVVEKDAAVRGLAVAGVNHIWDWAEVAFDADGRTLVVSSPACKRPLYARYAYWNNPYAGAANLYSAHLLPVAPFATDDAYYRSRLNVATATLSTPVTGEQTVTDTLVEMPQASKITLAAGAKLTVDGAEVRTYSGLYAANDAAVVFTHDGSLIADGTSTTGMLFANGAKNFAVTVRDGRSTLNRVDWLNGVTGEAGEVFAIVNAECHSPCQFCVKAGGLVAGQRRLVLTDGADRAARLVADKLMLQAPQLRVEWTLPSQPPKDAPLVGTLSATIDDGTVFAVDATTAAVPSGEVVTYPLVRSTVLTCDAAALLKNADIKVPANVVATLEASGKMLNLVLENEGPAVFHTVAFLDAAGNPLGEAQTVRQGRTASVPVAPRISGKTFAGWQRGKIENGKWKIENEELVATEAVAAAKVTADVTYRASYAEGGPVFDDAPVSYVWKAGWDGNWSDAASWSATGSKLGYPDEPTFASVTFGSDLVNDTIVTFVGSYAVKDVAFANAAPLKLLGSGGLEVAGSLTGAAGASVVLEKTVSLRVKGTLKLADGFGLDVSSWGALAVGVYPLVAFGTFDGVVEKLKLTAAFADGCAGKLIAQDGVLSLKVFDNTVLEPVPEGAVGTVWGWKLVEERDGGSVCVLGYTNANAQGWSWTVPDDVTKIDLLIVGGGGGGGYQLAGGGGGGGVVYQQGVAVTPQASFAIKVGAGGSGSTAADAAGSTGGASSFGTMVALGGGGGGSFNAKEGVSADCANAGGSAASGGATTGTGGKGAGGAANGVNGGAGVMCDISGTKLPYGAGGGWGGVTAVGEYNAGRPVAGKGGIGAGDGATFETTQGVSVYGGTFVRGLPATAGRDGLGGGGGGGGHSEKTAYAGARGGSGTVIIRYTTGSVPPDDPPPDEPPPVDPPPDDPQSETKSAERIVMFTDTVADGVTWKVPSGVKTIDYLVVGGGGGGGAQYGGGGGGGGVLFRQKVAVEPLSTLVIHVGAGGAGGTYVSNKASSGANGGASSLTIGEVTETVPGGGGGGGLRQVGLDGAAGGGGGQNYLGGKGTYGDRFAGGGGGTVGNGGGGSGGSGGKAQGAINSVAGDGVGGVGGIGRVCDITGDEIAYGGGGGGGGANNADAEHLYAVGGDGKDGGGNGGGWKVEDGVYSGVVATAGTDGLGGGGGGGCHGLTQKCAFDGARGGNGVVIIRYLAPRGFSVIVR